MTASDLSWLVGQLPAARRALVEQREPVLLALQRLTGRDIGEVMSALSHHCGWEVLPFQQALEMRPDFDSLGYAECLRQECLLLRDAKGSPWLVAGDPTDPDISSWACSRFAGDLHLAFLPPEDLQTLLAGLEGHDQAISRFSEIAPAAEVPSTLEEISLASIARDDSQVVRLVNSTLYDAHRLGASDIHFEQVVHGLVVKYRIDGVLSPARSLADRDAAEEVVSRIKILAELDIGERRIPQDGRFAVSMNGREIDLRVSVMPSLFGEDVVLRILDKQTLTTELSQLSLDVLGLDAGSRRDLRRLAAQPYGMLLVTGPTGSGKTTTLYATLTEVNNGRDKIITIEDPVEYQLPGVLQIPVNERKGLTFARGLRSILRHDPDRILVGEIRDRETAEIAVQAALTGHLVYTTVHANSVFDVLSRFRHMGVDIYSFVTALNGVVAQRLVRLLCQDCAVTDQPDSVLLRESGVAMEAVDGWDFKGPLGCPSCRGSGYRGRKAMAEVLVLTDELREQILLQAPVSQLKRMARERGLSPIREQALTMVRDGVTSLEEINRVTFVE